MPIVGIIDSPITESLNAAYRPIIFRVYARRTDGQLVPPLVYCDIYIRGIYYKTISKTQYDVLTNTESQWIFDIQDAVQEYLGKFIADNGEDTILEVSAIIADVFCKFRSSGYDVDGFIQSENTAPVQGTIDTVPIPGTGTVSSTFYVINSTLQHEDNQNLALHLNAYKNRTWDGQTYPLTHRPENYVICRDDSDLFPIVSNKIPIKIVLNYLPKNSSIWQQATFNAPCDPWTPLIPAVPGNINLPNAQVNTPYSYTIKGTQSGIILSNVAKPAWMTIVVSGNSVIFGGTPPAVAGAVAVSFDLTNCPGNPYHYVNTITVVCIPVSFPNGVPTIPDAFENQPYSVIIPLDGSQPYTLSNVNIPGWMSIAIVGQNVTLTGQPTAAWVGNNIAVQFRVTGSCGFVDVNDLIDVISQFASAYTDPTQYDVHSSQIVGICTVEIDFSRTQAAIDSATAANKTVRLHYYVQADNGCDGFFTFDLGPLDQGNATSVNLICGTGPCGGANAFLRSIEVL